MKVEDTKTVYVAWTNTDLTEGRGRQIPFAVCENIVTAERYGRGASVQGTDCAIEEDLMVKVDGKWLGPCRIISASEADIKEDNRRKARAAALAKAKKLGLTEKEIEFLS